MKKASMTNPQLIELVRFLKKQSSENRVDVWKAIAEDLARSKRSRISVNLSRLNRYSKKSETLAIPGKVLGTGELDHPVNVAAFAFSGKAREKISAAHGKCLSFPDLVKKNPKGSEVKIIG